MAVLPIRTWGDPVLKRRTREVQTITDDIRRLARDMMDTLIAQGGVGLAANQVGALERMFVLDLSPKTGPKVQYTVINPVITFRSQAKDTQEEGCLSFPSLYAPVTRCLEVEVQGLDLDGKPITIRGSGLLARAIQHETDHLDGVVYIERMNVVHRTMLSRQLRELSKQTKTAAAGGMSPR